MAHMSKKPTRAQRAREFRKLRESTGLSGAQFAELLGIRRESVWRLENEQHDIPEPTLRLARRLSAEVLKEREERKQ